MKGSKLADGTFSGTISRILNIGKLKVKTLVSSGETDLEAKALLGNKIFGNGWDATTDLMKIEFPIYLKNDN